MKANAEHTIYCSIDLELTGFDPSKDEILEVGFVLFTITPYGAQVIEEWTQVFKPRTEVRHKILGLTGIQKEELDQAPQFSEHLDFLQEKLRGVVIVGHGVLLDIKFLQAFGIQYNEPYIDTLDLVQFLLPTHHSYNLENLMHFFQVSHKEAHRALADARAVIVVLEKLLGIYNGFSLELRSHMTRIMDKQSFPWKELFTVALPAAPYPVEHGTVLDFAGDAVVAPALRPGTVNLFSLDTNIDRRILAAVGGSQKKTLLVVPNKMDVLEWWRQGLVRGIFSSHDLFDERKLKKLLAKRSVEPDLAKFILKILVWKYNNWQHETIVDLNLSFFGGQFKSLIIGGKLNANDESKIIASDYATFLLLAKKRAYKNIDVVLKDLQAFEDLVSFGMPVRAGWNYILHVLKSIYNPETDIGESKYKKDVVDALVATDLFFGVVLITLEHLHVESNYITYEALSNDPYVFNKIANATEHYIDKLERVAEHAGSMEITEIIKALHGFFDEEKDQVKWIEVGGSSCTFYNQPLHIAPIVQKALKPYNSITVIDTQSASEITTYLLERLGMGKMEVIPVDKDKGGRRIGIKPILDSVSHPELLTLLAAESLPAVLLFATPQSIKDFYDVSYQQIKKYGSIFAQGYSGGSNKMFRNFTISKKSLFIATDSFLLRTPYRKLHAKTVIITYLPQEKYQHPYMQALLNYWQGIFPNIKAIHTVKNVHMLFKMLYNSELEHAYIGLSDENPAFDILTDYIKNSQVFEIKK